MTPTSHEAAFSADGRRLCTLPGCGRPHLARNYCTTHYRTLAYLCSMEGCTKRCAKEGLCARHLRLRAEGSLEGVGLRPKRRRPSAPNARCMVEGCTRPHTAKGHCKHHYHALLYRCTHADCPRKPFTRGACWKHYRQQLHPEAASQHRRRSPRKLCMVEGCERKEAWADAERCGPHLTRHLRGLPPDALLRSPRRPAAD